MHRVRRIWKPALAAEARELAERERGVLERQRAVGPPSAQQWAHVVWHPDTSNSTSAVVWSTDEPSTSRRAPTQCAA